MYIPLRVGSGPGTAEEGHEAVGRASAAHQHQRRRTANDDGLPPFIHILVWAETQEDAYAVVNAQCADVEWEPLILDEPLMGKWDFPWPPTMAQWYLGMDWLGRFF